MRVPEAGVWYLIYYTLKILVSRPLELIRAVIRREGQALANLVQAIEPNNGSEASWREILTGCRSPCSL
jgi:hypothetical protein